jgi:hypothetical protein
VLHRVPAPRSFEESGHDRASGLRIAPTMIRVPEVSVYEARTAIDAHRRAQLAQ